MAFSLDAQLAADTVPIMDYDLCRVLLMKDANYPWIILVPMVDGISELHQLAPDQWSLFMAELTRTSSRMEAAFKPDKVNVGALGNIVNQLHIHIVCRYTADPAWPGPVWGAAPAAPYPDEDLDEWVTGFKRILG